MREALYSVAPLLVIGVIMTHVALTWAAEVADLTVVEAGKTRPALAMLPAAASVPYGLLYTTFLIAILLPAAIIVQRCAGIVAERAAVGVTDHEGLAEALKRHGLDLAPRSLLVTIFAFLGRILASMVSGPLAKLFGAAGAQ